MSTLLAIAWLSITLQPIQVKAELSFDHQLLPSGVRVLYSATFCSGYVVPKVAQDLINSNQVKLIRLTDVDNIKDILPLFENAKSVTAANIALSDVPQDSLRCFCKNRFIRELEIYGGKQSPDLIEQLVLMTQLEELKISHVPLGKIDLKYFRRLPNLKKLSLVKCGIKGADLDSLRLPAKLEELDISENNISDSIGEVLRNLRKLRRVNVCGNAISESGLISILQCAAIREIRLSDANIPKEKLDVIRRDHPHVTISD